MMDLEWLNIAVGAISTFIGLVGGGVGIYFWREYKALKKAEVKNAETEVEMKQAEEWNKLYKEQKAKSDEKSARLKTLYAERDKLKDDLSHSRLAEERLCWFYCTVNNCGLRQPPHRFDEMGREIKAEIFDKKDEQ